MKKFMCLIFVSCFFSNIQAAIINWVPGTIGDWNVAANWDSNTIPGAADEVIIVDGDVTIPDNYDALAIRVELSSISTLTINLNASLTLDGAVDTNAFENLGTFNCRGDLIIDHVTYSGNDLDLGNGISNKGDILVTSNGRILLNDIAGAGILNNNLTVSFENRGMIKVSTAFTGDNAIHCNNTDFLNTGNIEILGGSISSIFANTGNFINKGSINISNISEFGLLISGTFTNKGAGNIAIKNAVIGIGVYNSGDFTNNAILLIENSSVKGLDNYAIFTNGVNGVLTIDNCLLFGINNASSITNKGSIDIEYTTDGDGITNLGTIVNENSGTILLKKFGEEAIDNRAEGTIENYGTIIFLYDSTSESSGSVGLFNQGNFKNKPNSRLFIHDTLTIGIHNFNPNALLVNEGFIEISPTVTMNTGILIEQGQIRNAPDGLIDVNHAAQIGLEVFEGAGFLNEGFATFQGCDNEGAIIAGTVKNKAFFTCKSNDQGMLINPAGEFRNTIGSLSIEFNTNTGLENQGFFINKVKARLDIADPIDNTGDFRNKGFLFSSYDGLNTNTGAMKNTGAIEDIHEQVLPVINNKSVIATPLTGTVEVGVPYPDALNLGTQTNFVIGGWFIGASTTTASAGTYDQTTNVFTPDAAAIGQTSLYVQVTLNDGPLTDFLRVVVENEVIGSGGSSPMMMNDHKQIEKSRGVSNLFGGFSKITLSPNPARDYVNLSLDSGIETASQIVLYNSLGQLERSIPVSGLEAGVFRFDFEKQLNPGLYLLEIRTREGAIFKDRLLIINQ